jgi:hypothetical protein
MLTESPEEIFLRFERPKTVWSDLAYAKSSQRFLAFLCNAFEQDPEWQLIDAATLPEAKKAILNCSSRVKLLCPPGNRYGFICDSLKMTGDLYSRNNFPHIRCNR